MKRFLITLGMMVAATLSLTNCNKEYVETVLPASDEFTINAGFIDTKTANDGMNTTWSKGDTVAVFHAVAGTTDYVLDGKFVTSEGDGNFTGTLASALDPSKSYDWYMLFPYNEKLKTPAADTVYSYIGNRKSGLIQTGNDSMAHVCGKSFTLVGKTSGVAAATVPALQMKNIASLAAIKVTNSTSSAFTVTKVTLDAVDEDIVGSYFVNYSDIDNVVLTPSTGYVSTTSIVTVDKGEEIAAGASAIFYAAVKPYTAAAGKTIKVKVEAKVGTNDCSYEKEFSISSPVTFSAGKIKTINLPVSDMAVDMKSLPYSETFKSGLGDFKIENVTIPEGKTYVWEYNSYGYAVGKSGVAADSEGWLISPVIDLTSVSNAVLSFDHAHKFAGTPSEELTLWIREMGGSWSQLTIPTYSDQKSWSFLSESIDLSSYIGKAVQVAFKYVSTSSAYGTWEIKNFLVSASAPAKEFGVSTETIEVVSSATSASFDITGNVAWTCTSMSDGLTVSKTSGTGSATVKATFPANLTSNSVEYVISVATTEEVTPSDYEITIKQAASSQSTPISSLKLQDTCTISGTVMAVNDNGFVLGDDSGSVYVYGKTDKNKTKVDSVGRQLNAAIRVVEYANGKMYQVAASNSVFTLGEKVTPTYPTADNFDESAASAFISAESSHFAKYVTFTADVVPEGSYYNFQIGSVVNATTYYATTQTKSTLAEAMNITTTGYVLGVSSGKCTFVPTSITVNLAKPKLAIEDIQVDGAGVTNATTSVALSNADGSWSLSAACDGTIVTSASISGSTLTYTVAANTGVSREGSIIVTATKGSYSVSKTVKVSQTAGAGVKDPVKYTLQFGSDYNSKSVSSYTESWSATCNGFTWNLVNWNNNKNGWTYVKAGSKSAALVGTITTATAIPEAIKTVTITVDNLTSSMINSVKVYVASDSSFTSNVQTVTVTVPAAACDMVFTIPSPTTNMYYKVEVDCKQGSGNGLFTVSKIVYSE